MSKQINNGGSVTADLILERYVAENVIAEEKVKSVGGLSIRDYFAAAALQGLIQQRQEKGDADRPSAQSIEKSSVGLVYVGSFIGYKGEGDEYEASRDAYKFADAMLEARKGGGQP